jgi:hypothetical protein
VTPEATFPEKTQGFAHENVFTVEFSRSEPLALLYYSRTRTVFAHYVDMMLT